MSIIFRQSYMALGGAILLTLGSSFPATAFAPLFNEIDSYETIIDGSQDLADIYYPAQSVSNNSLPLALFLQGGNVEKSYYSQFASIIASYGFVVVVPNHISDSLVSFGIPEGYFSEQEQVNNVLNYITTENADPTSPIFGSLNSNQMVLLGHSYGGIVGLNAIQGTCIYPFCSTGSFTRPEALKGGAFYASALNQVNLEGITPPLNNAGIPIALFAGSLDGVTASNAVRETYDQIQQPPKSFISVIGANHYGIANVNNPSESLTTNNPPSDPNTPTLAKEASLETIARWSAAFLRGNVLDDQEALNYVNQTGDMLDTNVNVNSQTQSVNEPSAIFALLSFGLLVVSTFCRY